MRRVIEAEDFLSNPVGSHLISTNFAYWYPKRGLTGFAVWGSPNRADIQQLNRVMDVVLLPSGGRHLSLVDMQRLDTVDPMAFRAMAEYFISRSRGFGDTIIRQAIIRPTGFAGAVVAGFFAVVSPKYPVEIFDELAPAFAWLDVAAETDFCAAVIETHNAGQCTDAVLRRVRLALTEPPGCTDVDEFARRLGLSRRTLQRRLQVAGTTLETELCNAKLAQAQQLMLASELSLTTIALELGFASLQHFSATFRKRHGESPSGWLRKRNSISVQAHAVR